MMFPKPAHKKKKKIKRPSKTALKRVADSLFAQIIRSRGHCQAKGKDHVNCGGNLQCCHIITRGRKILAYDEQNALCMCAGHHNYYTNNPDRWLHDFIPIQFPEQWGYVDIRRNHTIPDFQYEPVIEKLKNRLVYLQSEKKNI